MTVGQAVRGVLSDSTHFATYFAISSATYGATRNVTCRETYDATDAAIFSATHGSIPGSSQ